MEKTQCKNIYSMIEKFLKINCIILILFFLLQISDFNITKNINWFILDEKEKSDVSYFYLDKEDTPVFLTKNDIDIINKITEYKCYNCIDISQYLLNLLPNIKVLNLSKNNIMTFNIENFISVENLDISENNIKKINVYNKNIRNLNLSSNEIDDILIDDNTNLCSLDISINRLENIFFVPKSIKYIDISNNKISKLIIEKSFIIEELYATNNQISTINLESNDEIEILWLDYNIINKFELTKIVKMNTLVLSNNKLSYIDLGPLQGIDYLFLNKNNLKGSLFLNKIIDNKIIDIRFNNIDTLFLNHQFKGQVLRDSLTKIVFL
ncbi:leucine-rich repeat domain-containing protein [Flammeovirga agarivorans]|uniref:Uncharacterized protein n=1 Tax=Flammeovirga agarivorans TaxID=2726742 RepID=A0A7X8SRH0_9BACT|nr:hypothetical protein [Flammeovirga agarivorans]NLR95067.1 hypothetical protein [Flammeovirga agarivorans]